MTRPLPFSLELVPSLPRVHVHVCMCTFVHVTATRACACVHVYVCACVHARAGIAPRAVPEGCAARGPQTSGRLRRARLEAWGHWEGCAARGLPGVIRKVALRAAFRGVIGRVALCAALNLHCKELRCARLQGLALCAGPREGLGRFREVALCAASGSADPRHGSRLRADSQCILRCCLARP